MSSIDISKPSEVKINLYDALDNSPKVQDAVDQIERGIAPLHDYVFSLRDAFQMFVVHQAELQESMNAIAELVLKFEHTGASQPGSFLCHAMSELGGQLKELCGWQEMLGLQLANGVIQPLTNFLLNDLTNLQRKKSAFQTAGKEHNEVTLKYSKASKLRETERSRFDANSDLYAVRKQFHQTSLAYYVDLNSVEYMKQCVLLQSMLSFMHSQLTHFKMGHEVLTDEVGKFLTNVNVEAQRANNQLQYELKMMKRDKEKIEEDFASYYNPDPDPSDPFAEYIPPNLKLTYKAGYLFHKHKNSGKWERYYFLTREGSLYMQVNHKRDPVLVMRARGSNVAPVNIDDRRYTFEVTHHKFKQPLFFQAENANSRDEWIATIRNISAFSGIEVPSEPSVPPPTQEEIQNERNRIKEWVKEQTKNFVQPLSPKKIPIMPGPDPDALTSALSKLVVKQEQADKEHDAMRLRKELNECHAQRDYFVTQKNTLEIKMSTLEQTKQQLLEQEQFNYVQGLEEASDEQKDQLAKQFAEKVAQLQGGFEKQVRDNSEEVEQVTLKITTLESKIHDLATRLVQLSSEDGHEPFDIYSPESCVVGVQTLDPNYHQQFTVRFLGSTEVKEPRGKVTITNTIRKVLAARAMQNIVKTQDSMMMVTEKKLQLLDSKTRNATVQFTWKNIPFWGFHPDNEKLFGFTTVSQQGRGNKYTCHVFEAETSGKAVLLAFSAAVQAGFAPKQPLSRKTLTEEVPNMSPSKTDQTIDIIYEDVEFPIPSVVIDQPPPPAVVHPVNHDYDDVEYPSHDHSGNVTHTDAAASTNDEQLYGVVQKQSRSTTAAPRADAESGKHTGMVCGYKIERMSEIDDSDEEKTPPHTEEMNELVEDDKQSNSDSYDDAIYERVNDNYDDDIYEVVDDNQ